MKFYSYEHENSIKENKGHKKVSFINPLYSSNRGFESDSDSKACHVEE